MSIFSFGTKWLNWQAVDNLNINSGLEDGWAERARSAGAIYTGATGALTIYGLSRSDLIATKMSAYLASERSKDLDDLRAINASPEEIENITDQIIHLLISRGKTISDKFGNDKGIDFLKRAISYIAKNEVTKK